MNDDTRQAMTPPPIELSDEGKKRLEEIALAAFHNLLIGVVECTVNNLADASRNVCGLTHHSTMGVIENICQRMQEPQLQEQSQ